MNEETPEIAFYRAVEDLFARLRGVPHTLSPKDFQLLRSWWREGVPLAAVVSGVTEVFARHAERGNEDPVVSLSYCRHAVRRDAKRLAEMRAGSDQPSPDDFENLARDLDRLDRELAAAAARLEKMQPGLSREIELTRRQLEQGRPSSETGAETFLFALETTLLRACFQALDPGVREEIEAAARRAVDPSIEDREDRLRILHAHRDRELRRRFGIPRLELS